MDSELVELVACARSPIVLDGYRREIELVPDSEAPGRDRAKPSTLAALAALVKLLDLRVGIRKLLRNCDVAKHLRL